MIDLNSKRLLSDRINEIIDDAPFYEEPKKYLGCSVLGTECERAVQYEAIRTLYPESREQIPNDFPPQVRRIFKRGFLFEDEAIKWFQNAGFHLITRVESTGKQLGVSWCDGQLRGHLDGIFVFYHDVVLSPSRRSPFELPALWEHKCVNEKNFKLVIKDKVKKAFPKYYAQMQMYMNAYSLKQGIITFTCANTMTLHHELVMYDDSEFQRLLRRAERVINATHRGEILPRGRTGSSGGQSPAHFVCKFCNYSNVCWA